MVRRRLNFKLFGLLSVGTIVFVVCVFLLHGFQQDRNADILHDLASEQLADGDLRNAKETLVQYVSLRPDDEEQHVALANLAVDIVELPGESYDQRQQDFKKARDLVENTLQKYPKQHDLRRRAANFYMAIRRPEDALSHLNIIDADNAMEAKDWLTYCQAKLMAKDYEGAVNKAYEVIGFDAEEDKFDSSKALAPDEVGIYSLLAYHLRDHDENSDMADRVMEQSVAANPGSHEALRERADYFFNIYRSRNGRSSGEAQDALKKAEADFQQALQLKGDDLKSMLGAANVQKAEKNWEQADSILQQGMKAHPKEESVYLALSSLANARDDFDGDERQKMALQYVEQGINSVPEDHSYDLMYQRAVLQMGSGDLEAARRSIAQLRRIELFNKTYEAVLDLLDARLMVAEHNWVGASKKLSKIRPDVASHPLLGVRNKTGEVDYYLGLCYERTGQSDLAEQSFRNAWDAGWQIDAVTAAIRRNERRTQSKRAIVSENSLEDLLRRINSLPKEERDWTAVNAWLDNWAETNKIDELRKALTTTQVYLMAHEYDRAQAVLSEAYKKNPKNQDIWFAAAAVKNAQSGPEEGLKTLDRIQKDFGDSARLRRIKAGFLAKQGDENLKDQLLALEEGIEQLSQDEEEQAAFWQQMARIYDRVKLPDDARRALEKVVAALPNSLAARRQLFKHALANGDADRMDSSLAEIEKMVGSDHSIWQYCEAQRLVVLVALRRRDKSTLDKAINLLDKALKQRPEWADPYRLKASIYLQLGKTKEAIANFEQAIQFGGLDPASIKQLYGLYLKTKQFTKAQELQDLAGSEQAGLISPQQQAIILFGRGEIDKGLAKAREAVEQNPDEPALHQWIARLYLQAGKKDRAETSLRKTVELAPDNDTAWYLLIASLVSQDKTEDAEAELRRAQLHLPDEKLPILLGRASALLGRRREAEQFLLMAHRARPDSLALTQAVAEYYLGRAYYRKDGPAKASVYLKKILAEANRVGADDPHVHWARRATASILASRGIHRDILKATKLVEKNAVDGKLAREDNLAIATLLAVRKDADSHQRAITAYEQVDEQQPLDGQLSLALAELCYKTGQWKKCRSRMYDLFTKYENSASIAAILCRMHLDRGELQEAVPPLDRLKKLAPKHPQTVELEARLLTKQGKNREAIAAVRSLLPEDPGPSDVPQLMQLARLLEELKHVAAAEQMYLRCSRIEPGTRLELANFYGRQQDLKNAFEILEELAISSKNLENIIHVGVQAIRFNRLNVGDSYDAVVQGWLDKGLRENPDSAKLLFALSDFEESQQKYAEAEKTYLRLIEHPDLDEQRRSIVLNNLAFLLGMRQQDPKRALGYIEEAIEVMGPTPDLLDTRGIVHAADQNYDAAVADLELALQQKKDPSIYLHLALVHSSGGDLETARATLKMAEQAGLDPRLLKPFERDLYQELRKQLEVESSASAL